MKISLKDTKFFDRNTFTGQRYVETKEGRGFNAILVTSIVGHEKVRLTGATRMYFIIEGTGTFTINGVEQSAEPNDFFLIESDDVYEYKGAMKMFHFNVPGTDSSNEEKLD